MDRGRYPDLKEGRSGEKESALFERSNAPRGLVATLFFLVVFLHLFMISDIDISDEAHVTTVEYVNRKGFLGDCHELVQQSELFKKRKDVCPEPDRTSKDLELGLTLVHVV